MRISFVKTLFPVLSVAVVFLYMSSVKWEIQTQEKQLHQVQQNFSLHSALLLNKLDKLEAHLIAVGEFMSNLFSNWIGLKQQKLLFVFLGNI